VGGACDAWRRFIRCAHLARQVGARAALLELIAQERIELDAAGRVAQPADRPRQREYEQRLEKLRQQLGHRREPLGRRLVVGLRAWRDYEAVQG